MELYFKGQNDPADEQEFFNSKLGLPHATKGARITDTELANCRGEFKRSEKMMRPALTTMGVDVGSWLHVTIDEWRVGYGNDINANSRPKTIWYGKVKEFEELDKLMRDFQINFCIRYDFNSFSMLLELLR